MSYYVVQGRLYCHSDIVAYLDILFDCLLLRVQWTNNLIGTKDVLGDS